MVVCSGLHGKEPDAQDGVVRVMASGCLDSRVVRVRAPERQKYGFESRCGCSLKPVSHNAIFLLQFSLINDQNLHFQTN